MNSLDTRSALPLSLALLATLLGACASTPPPPTAQVAASTAAIAHAAGAGGNELAPQQMLMARDKLRRANAAMSSGDYAAAGVLSREAQLDAELAEASAESAKARRAADALRDGNRVLREEMQRKQP